MLDGGFVSKQLFQKRVRARIKQVHIERSLYLTVIGITIYKGRPQVLKELKTANPLLKSFSFNSVLHLVHNLEKSSYFCFYDFSHGRNWIIGKSFVV